MHPYSSIDATATWKKLRFILSVRSDFHIIDSLLKAVHAFVNLVSMSFSIEETLLPRYKQFYFKQFQFSISMQFKGRNYSVESTKLNGSKYHETSFIYTQLNEKQVSLA